MAKLHHPRVRSLGDSAIIIQLGDVIDDRTNQLVHRLATRVSEEWIPGLSELVPSYCALTVHFDPLQTTARQVGQSVRHLAATLSSHPLNGAQTELEIPVLYGGEYGPDLADLAAIHGLAEADVIRLHSGTRYRVYLLGFAPGFPYLGRVPEEIATPRRPTPRTLVPAGSVGIADHQTGIYPIATPGGWQIIGRTPVPLFDPRRQPPSLLAPGDEVRFRAVEESEYLTLLGAKEYGGNPGTHR